MTDTLRLRMKMAMFKVETNQTSLPMSKLRLNSPSAPPTPKETLTIKDPPPRHRKRNRRSSTHDTRYFGKVANPASPPEDRHCAFGPWNSGSQDSAVLPPARHPQLDVDERSFPAPGEKTPSSSSQYPAEQPSGSLSAPISSEREVIASCVEVDANLSSSAVKGRAADSLMRLGASF